MIKIPFPREKMCEKTYFIVAHFDNQLIRFNFANGLLIVFSNTVIWVLYSNVIAIYKYIIDYKV